MCKSDGAGKLSVKWSQLEGDAGDRAWCGGKTGSSHHHIAQYLGEQMQDGTLAGRAPSTFPY